MHRPLLIASLAGSVLGGALPGLEARDNSPHTVILSTTETHVITASAACEGEDCDVDSTLTTTATAFATDAPITTQTTYVTAAGPLPSESEKSSPESSSIPDELPSPSGTTSISASNGQPVISHVSSSITDASAWPTLVPAVPSNQADNLDSLAPTNSSKLTFTLDGKSDPSTKHLFAELTANHTTPAVVLEHSAQIVDVSCAAQGLKVDLSTAAAVDFVRSAWSENFVAITSSADCGGTAASGHHSYWNVTSVTYPAATLTALLDAAEIDVEDFFDHVNLVWGAKGPKNTTAGSAPPKQAKAGASKSSADSDSDDKAGASESSAGSDSDDDSSDDEDGGYFNFDEDFASALHDFAPGLSTYAEEDYENEDSPANGTAGDPDYDIWNSGIIDTEGAQPSDQPVQKRQDYPLPEPARKPYAPPEPKPAKKAQNLPVPEPARKPYAPPEEPPAQKAQKAEVAKEGAKGTDVAYKLAQTNLKNARKAAQTARGEYFHARLASRARPNDKVLAAKLTTAKAKLATANKAAKQSSDIAQTQAKAAKASKKKAAAAQSIQGKGGSKGKGGKANPMAVADKVTKGAISNVEADPQLLRNAKSTAGGLVGFLRRAYTQLVRTVRSIADSLSNMQPDYTFSVDYSLADTLPGWVDQDSPWGPQVLFHEDEVTKETLHPGDDASASWKLYCVDCGFTANIFIAGEISFSVSQLSMTKGTITVEGTDIAAKLMLGLEAFAAAQWAETENVVDVAIPPGFSIPRIITLGPAIRWDMRASIRLEAEANVLVGGEATFSDFSTTVDLVDRDKPVPFDGLVPDWTPRFEAYGAIRAGLRIGYPFSIGITMHLPMIKKDRGIAITTEPYLKAVASYGDNKNCSKGIDYRLTGGNDIYLDISKFKTFDIKNYETPAMASGCLPIPSEIAAYLPPGLSDQFPDEVDDEGAPDLDSSDIYATAEQSFKAAQADGSLVFAPVSAGSGEWYLFAGMAGGLELVPPVDAATDDRPDLAQQMFAHIDGAVTADDDDRLLYYDRRALADPALQVSPLRFVAEEYLVPRQDGAVVLVPVEAEDGEGSQGEAVLVPMDSEGYSYVPVACVVTARDPHAYPVKEITTNDVFMVVDADEGIERLEAGGPAVERLVGGVVGECTLIALDAAEGI